MRYEDPLYPRERERQCRSMAKVANDPIVERRHKELAKLHAARAAYLSALDESSLAPTSN